MRQKDRRAEKRILDDALRTFEEVTGTPAIVLPVEIGPQEGGVDAVVRLGREGTLVAEVKRTLTPATLGHAVAQLQRFKGPAIIVTPYVTPQMAERLKALDVPFVDTAGNAYVKTPGILIYVTGRKVTGEAQAERPVRVFRATGLRLIFALLCRPELTALPYREIANAAGVALGTVNTAIKDLKRLRYLRETKAKGRVLENPKALMDVWAEAYHRELRPRLKPRRFKVANPDWWKTEDLAALDMWLGGEPAATVLTKHLRPGLVTVYGDAHFADLARTVRPAKDAIGNLELLQKFWNFEPHQPVKGHRLAPPLLIYADLLATADARNLEAAEIIRERFLV
jgi:hypothetical protein